MNIKKAAIVVNPRKEKAIKEAQSFSKWLSEKGITSVIPEENSGLIEGLGHDIASADIFITLGGDGTVLKAVHLLENKETPLLTVNFGRVGFLAEVKPENLKEDFQSVLDGKFNTVKKRLLHGKVNDTGKEFIALNDVIIANKGYRTLNLDVYVKESFLYSYSCDGFVISTPTGSTAYSLSLGGPILTPDVNAKVLIPVNPHTLFNKSLIVSEDEDVKILARDSKIEILADGIVIDSGSSNSLNIGFSNEYINIIRFDKDYFIEHLRERLFKL